MERRMNIASSIASSASAGIESALPDQSHARHDRNHTDPLLSCNAFLKL
jgi:hypothetical protein